MAMRVIAGRSDRGADGRHEVDRHRGRAWAAWAPPLLVVLVAIALYLLPGAERALEYDRSAVLAGEVWRLVSGHLVHRSLTHLGWDVLAFAVLATLCAARRPRATWLALSAATLAIPLVLLALVPGLDTYRGLSGLDSTLFVLAALLLAGEAWRAGCRRQLVAPAAALALFVVKVGFEAVTGSAWFAPPSAPGEVVVPLAHLVGAAAALVPFAVRPLAGRRRRGGRPGALTLRAAGSGR